MSVIIKIAQIKNSKYIYSYHTGEAYYDDPYSYYDYGINRPALPDAGTNYFK